MHGQGVGMTDGICEKVKPRRIAFGGRALAFRRGPAFTGRIVKDGASGRSRRLRARSRCPTSRWRTGCTARKGEEIVKRGPAVPASELEAELSRLRQENAKLRLEKEILKRAAAYFARESM